MRAFDSAFAAAIASPSPLLFWSAEFKFDGGSVYVAELDRTIDGHDYKRLLAEVGDIESAWSREEKRLDVEAVQLQISNFPGYLAGDVRFSSHIGPGFESVEVDVHLNAIADDGSISRALMVRGVPRNPGGVSFWGFKRAPITILPKGELYFNKRVLRSLSEADFPFIRQADGGQSVPIVLGPVARSPGRIVKGRYESTPIADSGNSSTAQLREARANPGAAAQTWTLEFTTPETQAQTTDDGDFEVGADSATAQAFDAASADDTGSGTTTTKTLSGFTVTGTRPTLVVTVATKQQSNQPRVTGITYNGVALEEIADYGANDIGAVNVEAWALVDAPTGAHDIVVTMSLAARFVVSAQSFTEAGRPVLLGTKNTNGPQSSISQSVAAYAGLIVLDAVAREDSTGSLTVGAGQTQRTQDETSNGTASLNVIGATSTEAGGSSVTMSWSWSGNYTALMLILGIPRRQKVAAQSFQPTGTQLLAGFRLKGRRNSSYAYPAEATATIALCADNSNSPSTTLIATATFAPTSTSDAVYDVLFPAPVTVTAGTRYWPRAVSVNWLSKIATGGITGVAPVILRKNSAGGYASGKANNGVDARCNLTGTPSLIWLDGMATEDFYFEAIFVAGTYTFTGSVSGSEGTGTTSADETSDDGQVTIPAAAWQGTPAAGDVFAFDVDPSDSIVLLSESPTATPITSIGEVFWNEVGVGSGATIAQLTSDAHDLTIGQSSNNRKQRAQTITISTPGLYAGFKLEISRTSSSPAEPLVASLVRLVDGVPEGEVLASKSIAASEVTTSAVTYARDWGDGAVALDVGTYGLIVNSLQSSTTYYTIGRASSDRYSGGRALAWDSSLAKWIYISGTEDLVFELTAATITKTASGDPGDGSECAFVAFDVEIPDDVTVTADVTGIKDDTSGTYTGAPSQLIAVPGHVVHWLLSRAGAPDAEIDLTGTFAATNAAHGSLYRRAGVIQDVQQDLRGLLLQLGFETRAQIDWRVDRFTWEYEPDTITANATIDLDEMPQDSDGLPLGFSIQRADGRATGSVGLAVINSVDVRFQRLARIERSVAAYGRLLHDEDGDSIDLYGELVPPPELLMLDFTADEASAANLAAFVLARKKEPPTDVTFTVPTPRLALEKGDDLSLDLPEADGWDPILPSTDVFRIHRRKLLSKSKRLELTGRLI